jgi:hypothetical protein
MTARIIRAIKRPVKRLLRPLQARVLKWRIEQSAAELARLREMRVDLMQLERIEIRHQTQLSIRRIAIERPAP